MSYRLYKRRLSHARREDATYLVTWAVQRGVSPLAGHEREAVAEILRFFDRDRYLLHAFVVMNDHVHVVVTPANGLHLERTIQSWKGHSAKAVNRMRGCSGRLWQPEYVDRILTGRWSLEDAVAYVINNPGRRWPKIEVYPWVWWSGMREEP